VAPRARRDGGDRVAAPRERGERAAAEDHAEART
jgi:hypothetical protein